MDSAQFTNVSDVEDAEAKANDKEIEPEDVTEAIDALQKKLGGYGRYQIMIYILLCIVYMRGSWHAFISIYQNLVPTSFHCKAAKGLPLNESVPQFNNSDGHLEYDSCLQYVNYSLGNQTNQCSRGWWYDFGDSNTNSIVSEYDLICGKEYLSELTITMYMVGATCGVIFLTPLSEMFGAKNVMLICLWVQAIFGTVLIWVKGIIVFLVLKFFIGLTNMTIALCVAVMMSETFDSTHRELPVIGTSYFWACGLMLLSLFGYLLPDWKDLELVITLPVCILSITYIWLIPQSVPWLISKKRYKEVGQVIRRFISVNNLSPDENLDEEILKLAQRQKDDEKEKPINSSDDHVNNQTVDERSNQSDDRDTKNKSYNVFDILCKFPKLRIRAILLSYLFFVNSVAYFGISYNIPYLDGNRFLNLFYSGLVEIPAYTLSILANKCVGRRRSIAIFLLVCGICNITVPFVPNTSAAGVDLTNLKLTLTFIGKFGITGSYACIYLYASEIFPTVLRNQGVGFCSFFENLGSIAAPNIVYVSQSYAAVKLASFGVLTILGSIIVLLLPETHNKPLPQTVEDVEGKKPLPN